MNSISLRNGSYVGERYFLTYNECKLFASYDNDIELTNMYTYFRLIVSDYE